MPKRNKILVNISHIREKGLLLTGELPASEFDIVDTDRLQCKNPLEYELQLNLVSKRVLITGKVKTVLTCRCDRCLTFYKYSLETNDVCHYIDIPMDKQLDLTEDIREDMLMAFPQKLLCTPTCLGLCSHCGKNLNIQSCCCSEYENTMGIWNNLDKLQI